ncbi:MAG: SURF1 family protein [Actinomycetota bacterium]
MNLWRGRWLVGHALVVAVAAAFVGLGVWQYGRHQDAGRAEDAARAAFGAPAPALTSDNAPPSGTRVELTGTYRSEGEVLLRNRVRDGDGGYDILTPMRTAAGEDVIIDRGWLPRRVVDGADADAEVDTAVPTGSIVVRGIVQEPRALQPQDSVDERARRLALPRVDLDRIAGSNADVRRDLWVIAQYQDPAPSSDAPALPEPPDESDVNHLSYALQWFAMAAIPLVGWPIVLTRTRRRTREP